MTKFIKTPIPAVCENPECRAVFVFPNFIHIAEGKTANFTECKLGPCPKCGSQGLVPSGRYSNVGTAMLFEPTSKKDRGILERALGLARDAIDGKISAEKYQEAALERAPELSALWKLMPATKEQAYNFWMLVFMAIGLLQVTYQGCSEQAPPRITVPKEIIDAIQLSRRDNLGDTRKGPNK